MPKAEMCYDQRSLRENIFTRNSYLAKFCYKWQNFLFLAKFCYLRQIFILFMLNFFVYTTNLFRQNFALFTQFCLIFGEILLFLELSPFEKFYRYFFHEEPRFFAVHFEFLSRGYILHEIYFFFVKFIFQLFQEKFSRLFPAKYFSLYISNFI